MRLTGDLVERLRPHPHRDRHGTRPQPDLCLHADTIGGRADRPRPVAASLPAPPTMSAAHSGATPRGLTQQGFYTGLTCHRLTVKSLYVLQCGDPNGDGSGGPGYSFGPIENAPKDGVYPAGTIAMANTGQPNSQGSQFFLVYKDTTLP